MTNPQISIERPAQSQTLLPHACTECRRRKQKCDRQWPCNHCQKRKVVDLCRFKDDSTKSDQPEGARSASAEVKRKHEQNSSDDEIDTDAAEVLEAIGYSRGHVLAKLDEERNRKTPGQYRMDPKTCPQLKRALDVLPPRHIVDTLIQNFLDVVNFYYYIVYPPSFSKEYADWWKDHNQGRPHGLQWTCLLLMVCACSVQHIDGQLRRDIEEKLGMSAKELTMRYHDAARELHSAIPVGEGHIYSVQYLLHSCYWFKAEARFAECWQVLGAVVREAQMIDLHKKPVGQMPGFELEMKRRLWCIVDSWDWLVSSLLARPMLIDRSECDVGLPALTFENYPASPMLHLKLQAELVGLIFKRFGPPKLLDDPKDINDYQVIMEDFMKTFPAEYAMDHPNTINKNDFPWIALHRHYMHTCTLAIALGPFRAYMAKSMTKNHEPSIELKFRQDGVNYALKLMDAVHRFFEYVWTRDTTFHFVPFCIFDTAALLCSALLHDEDGSIPQRDEITAAIAKAFATLKKLRTATTTAKAPYDVLRRLIKKLPISIKANGDDSHKRRRFDPPPPGPQPSYTSSSASRSTTSPESSHSGGSATIPAPASGQTSPYNGQHIPMPGSFPVVAETAIHPQNGYTQYTPPTQAAQDPILAAAQQAMQSSNGVVPAVISAEQPRVVDYEANQIADQMGSDFGLQVISDAELGDLAMLWNWQSLDLGFTSNPIYQE